ncbi:MAG: thiol-disulfide isomerase/thioredoxin, partial [Pirellulaceae bacterium]
MVMSQRAPFPGLFLNIILCTVAALTFVGCGSPDVEPTDEVNNGEQTNAVAPTENGEPSELPQFIPGMPPELGGPPNPETQVDLAGDLTKKSPTELLAIADHLEAQLEGLASRGRSNPISQEEMDAERERLLSQLLSASSTVFDSKEANAEQRIDATRVKAESMARLIQFDAKYNDMLKTFAEVAATDANERIAAIGGVYSFLFSIHDVMREADPLPISHLEAMFKRVVENNKIGISEFVAVDSALKNLSRSHLRETVVPLRGQLAAKFANSDDVEVSAAATQVTTNLAHQTLMHSFEQHIFSIFQDKADETTQTALVEATVNIIKTSPTGPVFAELSNQSMNLEYSGHPSAAAAINSALEAGFANHESAEVQANVAMFLDEAKKRIGAIGQKFELEGIQLDGSEFNWDAYRGKVVLIDFWASYCRPCIEEMPNVIENYEKFHEQGFEVVGINVDPQISEATAFLERRKLPWPTIVSKDPSKND